MSDLFRNDFMGETLNAHKTKSFDTFAAADCLSKKLLISGSLMAPIETFVQRKTDSAIGEKKRVFAKASRMELARAMKPNGDIIEEPPGQSGAGSEEPPVEGPPDVDRKAVRLNAKNATFNDIRTRPDRCK